jgi:hypothetical protein
MADVRHSYMCARTGEDGRCRGSAGSAIIHLAARGQFFATRDSARQIIAEEIDTLARSEGVILDWAGVQAVTGAFASEFAGWCLSADRRYGSIGMNDEVREAYVTACRRLEGGD